MNRILNRIVTASSFNIQKVSNMIIDKTRNMAKDILAGTIKEMSIDDKEEIKNAGSWQSLDYNISDNLLELNFGSGTEATLSDIFSEAFFNILKEKYPEISENTAIDKGYFKECKLIYKNRMFAMAKQLINQN